METNAVTARRARLQPMAAALLGLGLLLAVATDGRLPTAWANVLFGALFVLDLITIEWLTRPSTVGRARAASDQTAPAIPA